jgi:8-oxo-dGTP pyrophosphatase MutT (NUDIX family)
MSSNQRSDPRHVKHREAARVILHNPQGEILLMLTHWDPGTGLPPRWLTPGGGIDSGETTLQAAIRELFEETGIRVNANELGEVIHRIEFRLDWTDGSYETGVHHFYELLVETPFELNTENWTLDEHRDVLEVRWHRVDELSELRLGPQGLLEFLEQRYANR